MPPTSQELSLLLNPLVPDSAAHNNRVLSNIRSLSGFVLGIAAGILGLESYYGFLFYILGSCVVSGLVQIILAGGNPEAYFAGPGGQGSGAWREVWFGGGVLGEALSGFVLGWAGVGGVIR